MPEAVKNEEGIINFKTLGKIFFLSGVISTLIASPIYAWNHWADLSVGTWIILFFVAPIINGFISLVFLLVTFPVYRWLARKNVFNFRRLSFVVEQQKNGSDGKNAANVGE